VTALDYDQIAHLYDFYVKADFDINFFLREMCKTSGDNLDFEKNTLAC